MKIQDILTESQLDVVEGWKTGALIGGTLGGAVGGAPGAIAGGAAGSAIGAMMQQNKRKKAEAEAEEARAEAYNRLENLRIYIGQMIDQLEEMPKNQMSIRQETYLNLLAKMDYLLSEEPVESFNYLRNMDISSENFAVIAVDFVHALWPEYKAYRERKRLQAKHKIR